MVTWPGEINNKEGRECALCHKALRVGEEVARELMCGRKGSGETRVDWYHRACYDIRP
jgi:hypothetical protein